MLLLYLAVLITALYWVSKMLLPEMAKPPLPRKPARSNSFETPRPDSSDNRLEKLELLLAEKNKNINVLQTELSIFLVQVREFDKIRSLLEDEIHRLREQNRIFRSELGMPTIAPSHEQKEKSII